jgi:hypothetical protein
MNALYGYTTPRYIIDWLLNHHDFPAPAIAREDHNCDLCQAPSGWSLVCEDCRRRLTPSQERRIMGIWHALMREKGRDPIDPSSFWCFHCEQQFSEDEVCGDHWPHSRGARIGLRFDTRNGVPCCKACNTSGSPHRKRPGAADFFAI